jgi:hypothetical protein
MTNHEEDRVMDEVDSSAEATQIEQGTTQTHKEKLPDLGLKIGINRENSIVDSICSIYNMFTVQTVYLCKLFMIGTFFYRGDSIFTLKLQYNLP